MRSVLILNRKVALIMLVSVVLFFNLQPSSAVNKKGEKMNIVFILADDLRWNSLHCMGNDVVITPNIDNLANEGVKFNNACVTTPICCCSRASLLTGQYMSRHGVKDFVTTISPDDFPNTYPSMLRDNGYWTGFVGKYGVGKIRKQDFDFSRIYEGVHWYLVNRDRPDGVPVYGNTTINRRSTKKSTFVGDSIHCIDRSVDDAMDFLANRPKDKPFNLSLNFFAPHAEDKHVEQYLCRPSSEHYYQDVIIPTSLTSTEECYNALPPFIASEKNFGRVRWHWRFDTPEKFQIYMKRYYRLVTDVDYAVGRVVEELKSQGVYENTLIVFMGDNGYFHSDHQLADKWYPYEQSIRVPLIVYDPRLPNRSRGKSNDEFALNIDIAPTLLKAVGLDAPEEMQGEDLSPLYLSRKSIPWRQDFFVEHPTIRSVKAIPRSEALVTHTEKYINWPDYSYEEYFNLTKDPNEMCNGIEDANNKLNIDLLRKRFEELKISAQ